MKATCSRKVRSFVLGVAINIGLGFMSPAFAADTSIIVNPDGKVTYLRTLGGAFTVATDINDSGQVVGYSVTGNDRYHAFMTGPNGVGMTDLGTLGGDYSGGTGINAAGQAVGESATGGGGEYHAFMTGPNGAGMTDLGTLGGTYSLAYGINDSPGFTWKGDTLISPSRLRA